MKDKETRNVEELWITLKVLRSLLLRFDVKVFDIE